MISFFTSLKPFRGTTGIQQTNALRSWRAAVPDSEIIVFDRIEGGEPLIAELGITYVPEIARNEFGTPLISAMFAEAQRMGRHDMQCYINGDIIVLSDFRRELRRLARWPRVVAVGQRWNLDCDEAIDFDRGDWEKTLRQTVQARGEKVGPLAIDFFAFKCGSVAPLPDFAIGRPAWDNYLIRDFLRRGVPIVDVSGVVRVIHQNHDYGHVKKSQGGWNGPEANKNRTLAGSSFKSFEPRHYSIRSAQWVMGPRAVMPALAPSRLYWRIPGGLRAMIERAVRFPRFLRRNLPRIGAWLLFYLDLKRVELLTRRPPRDDQEVAVLRLDNIGDFVLWLDAARAIRKRYPKGEYRITLFANHVWAHFAEASGLFDAVIPVERSRYFFDPAYRRALLKRIVAGRFAHAITALYSRSPMIDDILAKATGAKDLVAHEGDLANADVISKWIADRWYGTRISGGEQVAHELEKNLVLARHFDPQAALRRPRLEPGMIATPPGLPPQDYYVIVPGATATIRKWPTERFAQIAQAIHDKTGWTGVLCGAAGDHADAERIIAAAAGIPLVNLCGKTSLPELAGALARAKLAVTNETGSAHLGAALGTPTCIILGGGHFGRFAPYPDALEGSEGVVKAAYRSMACYRCNWQCVFPRRPDEPGPCVAAITVEDVWRLIEALLPVPDAFARRS